MPKQQPQQGRPCAASSIASHKADMILHLADVLGVEPGELTASTDYRSQAGLVARWLQESGSDRPCQSSPEIACTATRCTRCIRAASGSQTSNFACNGRRVLQTRSSHSESRSGHGKWRLPSEQSVPPQRRVAYPLGLEPPVPVAGSHGPHDRLGTFVKAHPEVPEADIEMLSQIQFRGEPPKSLECWEFIYQAIRNSEAMDT